MESGCWGETAEGNAVLGLLRRDLLRHPHAGQVRLEEALRVHPEGELGANRFTRAGEVDHAAGLGDQQWGRHLGRRRGTEARLAGLGDLGVTSWERGDHLQDVVVLDADDLLSLREPLAQLPDLRRRAAAGLLVDRDLRSRGGGGGLSRRGRDGRDGESDEDGKSGGDVVRAGRRHGRISLLYDRVLELCLLTLSSYYEGCAF